VFTPLHGRHERPRAYGDVVLASTRRHGQCPSLGFERAYSASSHWPLPSAWLPWTLPYG
jgi:hypothetical protein